MSAQSYQHEFTHRHPQASGTRGTHGLGYPESELRRGYPNTCGTERWEEVVWAPRSSDYHFAVQVGARTQERPCWPRAAAVCPADPQWVTWFVLKRTGRLAPGSRFLLCPAGGILAQSRVSGRRSGSRFHQGCQAPRTPRGDGKRLPAWASWSRAPTHWSWRKESSFLVK